MKAPPKSDPRYTDWVINLSKKGVGRQGILNEPRVFFDEIAVDVNGQETAGNPGAFENGEPWPVRITHMIAGLTYLDAANNVDNQQNIQEIGLRLIFHDQNYMNPNLLALPVWSNKVVAASDVASFATASWDFVATAQPFVLSARDTLLVDVQLRDNASPSNPVPITVTFTGFGRLSKRPYIFTGQRDLADLQQLALTTTDFKNDGSEPVIITDMTVNVGAEEGSVDPRGAIERLRLNVRQTGNGTNSRWFKGPASVPLTLMQASMLSVTSGRAVVHELPGNGIYWEPGEGITVSSQLLDTTISFDSSLALAFAGYVMVQ